MLQISVSCDRNCLVTFKLNDTNENIVIETVLVTYMCTDRFSIFFVSKCVFKHHTGFPTFVCFMHVDVIPRLFHATNQCLHQKLTMFPMKEI